TTAIGGAVLGLVIWLAGARFSRQLICLILTAVGAVIGLQVPDWMHWEINRAGPAVGAAVVFGVIGFLTHRMWLAVNFGAVLAIWAGLSSWVVLNDSQPWVWPARENLPLCEYCSKIVQQVPPDIARL